MLLLAGTHPTLDRDDIDDYLNRFKGKEEIIIKSKKPFAGWDVEELIPQECRIN